MSSLIWSNAIAPINWVSGIGVNWNTPDREKSAALAVFLDESVSDVKLGKLKSVSFAMGFGASGKDNIRDVSFPFFMGMGATTNRQYTKTGTFSVSMGESPPTHNIETVTLASNFGMSVGFNYQYTKTATFPAEFDVSISDNMPTAAFEAQFGQAVTPNYQYTQTVTLTSYLGSTSSERKLWEPDPEVSTTWSVSADPSTTWTKVSK